MIRVNPKICNQCGCSYKKKPHSTHNQFRKSTFCSTLCHGEFKKNQIGYWTGKKRPGLKGPQQWKKGADHPCWRGGISRLNKESRHSYEYAQWRKKVIERDEICVWCKSSKNLQVDHIKPFSTFPELRFTIDNGRVLCRDCHIKTPSYGFWPKKEGFYV